MRTAKNTAQNLYAPGAQRCIQGIGMSAGPLPLPPPYPAYPGYPPAGPVPLPPPAPPTPYGAPSASTRQDPGSYYGHPGYQVYAVPPKPRGGPATTAGIMWILGIIRNAFFSAFFWVAMNNGGTPTIGALPETLVALPLVGLASCAVAAYCDFTRSHLELGTMAAYAAVATSAWPGMFFFGPFGLIFTAIGLAMHRKALKQIKARDEHWRLSGALA